METKNKLRKKFLKLRKKKYFHVHSYKFAKLISYIKKKYTKSCLLNTTSSTNFVATFSDRLNSILSFQLINYTIPYTWYNIDSQYFNNQFTIYTSANDISAISIELLSGNYTLNNIYDTINDIIKNSTNLKPTQKINYLDNVKSYYFLK